MNEHREFAGSERGDCLLSFFLPFFSFGGFYGKLENNEIKE